MAAVGSNERVTHRVPPMRPTRSKPHRPRRPRASPRSRNALKHLLSALNLGALSRCYIPRHLLSSRPSSREAGELLSGDARVASFFVWQTVERPECRPIFA
ncbi:hypothetical protein BCAR13_520199 [Paraburkholderia caribensis]|nr:hypothetical protein BCAR13_520199 [Paraburkholderia caribensis]